MASPCRNGSYSLDDAQAFTLALLEGRVAELQAACDRLRDVLGRWDTLLDRTPAGKRAALLDALEAVSLRRSK